MYELGIIFLTCGVLAVIFPTIWLFYTENLNYLWWFLVALVCVILGVAFVCGTPKKSDVLVGKANYVEELNIFNGDTIRTYSIKWRGNE